MGTASDESRQGEMTKGCGKVIIEVLNWISIRCVVHTEKRKHSAWIFSSTRVGCETNWLCMSYGTRAKDLENLSLARNWYSLPFIRAVCHLRPPVIPDRSTYKTIEVSTQFKVLTSYKNASFIREI